MKNINIERIVLVGVLVVTSAGWVGRVTAQQQTQPDVLPALLEEVKGLRAAMEQMASAGPRVQLFASRLQLQETRINNMIRRLESVRDSLTSAQRAYAQSEGQLQQLEAAANEQRNAATAEAREEAKQAEFMMVSVKRELASTKATVDRLTAEEAQLTQDLSVEQARWTDINARLDELERTLAGNRPRR